MARHSAPRRLQSAQESRYVEEVQGGSDAWRALLGRWQGQEEDEASNMKCEALELKADGSFEHSVWHIPDQPHNSTCSGRWQLFNVRHLGADLAAQTDRELSFERGQYSIPLHVEKLVVCGVNPEVNGFLGAACRLYPAKEAAPRRPTRAPTLLPAQREPTEEDAKVLVEVTGLPLQECLAALTETRMDHDAAVKKLLRLQDDADGETQPAGPEDGRGPRPTSRDQTGDPPEASAEALAEATGRSIRECAEALQRHGNNADSAVVDLLGLPPSSEGPAMAGGGSASSSSLPAPGEASGTAGGASGSGEANPGPTQAQEVTVAARLSEMTMAPLDQCLEALRQAGGNPDDAGARLLGLHSGPLDVVGESSVTPDGFANPYATYLSAGEVAPDGGGTHVAVAAAEEVEPADLEETELGSEADLNLAEVDRVAPEAAAEAAEEAAEEAADLPDFVRDAELGPTSPKRRRSE